MLTSGSYLLTHKDLRPGAGPAAATAQEEVVDGVVLTHGTDTTEETAYLVDLTHTSDKPVAVTGAQRTPDSAGHGGEAHLRDATTVAAAQHAWHHGVLIVFAGEINPARGTQKLHTISPSPSGGTSPVGVVAGEHVGFHAVP